MVLTNSDLTLENSFVGWSANSGVYASNASSALNCNIITDNTTYGLYNSNSTITIDARNNYWGDASGPYHPTTNPLGAGDRVSDRVLYSPWLSVPCGAVVYSIMGRIQDSNNQPLAGALLAANSGQATLTDASGYYTFTNLMTGTYSVTPTLGGYTFAPITRTVTIPPSASAQDFIATQNAVTSTCPVTQALDAVFVVDRSGSMVGQPMLDVKQAANLFLDRLDLLNDQAGVASFADIATLNHILSQPDVTVRAALNNLNAIGGAAMGDGITIARQELTSIRHRAVANPVMIVLSDGYSNAGSNPLTAATAAKNAGIRIVTVGLGPNVDSVLMRAVASAPTDYYTVSGRDL